MEKKTEKMTSSHFIDEPAEEWEDLNCLQPDPNKLEKILVEIVDSFNDLIHGAAFNFLLTEGQSTEFNYPFDKQDPKSPEGDAFSRWKMRWYSTLDPWFLSCSREEPKNSNFLNQTFRRMRKPYTRSRPYVRLLMT